MLQGIGSGVLAMGRLLGMALVISTTAWQASRADDYEREPIQYSRATSDNRVSRLQARLDGGTAKLTFDAARGYLPSVLKELQVSPQTQSLVFSKTSLQRQRISPRTPRAIYFNDEVYVGYCQHGDVMEVSAVDPQLGAV